MYEVKIDICPNLSIILAKTKDGPRPLRWDGRDFIKVLYNPPGLNPPIYQAFYRSTGLHDAADDTSDVWTPTDGIVRQMSDISNTWISKVSHIGFDFAKLNWKRPNSGKDPRKSKTANFCDKEMNDNSILCRFGNCNLIKISFLISKSDNRFWKTEKGTEMKTICNIDPSQISFGDNIDIVKGVAVDDYIIIDKFIGQAISFNHVDDIRYKNIREKFMNGKLLFGPYDLNDCIVKHPTLGDSIFQGAPEQHCKMTGKIYSEKFSRILKSPEESNHLLQAHLADVKKDKEKIFEGMDFPQTYNPLVYPSVIAGGAAGGEDYLEMEADFENKCDKYDINTLIDIAKRLKADIMDKNGKNVNRSILCNRIMKKLNETL